MSEDNVVFKAYTQSVLLIEGSDSCGYGSSVNAPDKKTKYTPEIDALHFSSLTEKVKGLCDIV